MPVGAADACLPCKSGAKLLEFNQVEKNKQVSKLLEQGLYHYGHGETGLAVELWKQVVDVDPRNEVAREYLSIELGPDWMQKLKLSPTEEPAKAAPVFQVEKPQKIQRPEFSLAQQHLRSGNPDSAYLLFARLMQDEPDNFIYTSFFEMSKACMVTVFLKRAGGFGRVPVLKMQLSKIQELKLTLEQGFILSLINGETSLEDIVYLSPVPPFVTFSTLKNFYETGLIGLKEQGA